jgi:hypothetical protein
MAVALKIDQPAVGWALAQQIRLLDFDLFDEQ